MITDPHTVSTPDMTAEERAEYEGWLAAFDRGHFDDEAPSGEGAEEPEPTLEDRQWWSQQLGHEELPDSELLCLSAGDWAEINHSGDVAYELARDRGECWIEALRERDAAETDSIRFFLGWRAKGGL